MDIKKKLKNILQIVNKRIIVTCMYSVTACAVAVIGFAMSSFTSYHDTGLSIGQNDVVSKCNNLDSAFSFGFKLDQDKIKFSDLKSTVTLKPVYEGEDEPKGYNWRSTNPQVATVDEDGKVTPKMNGRTTIVCTEEVSYTSAQCDVTVDTVYVRNVDFEKCSLDLFVNDSYTIKANVGPRNADNKKLDWLSSNEKVAKVDLNGKVTALAPGEAIIFCKTTDDSNIVKTCSVNVKSRIRVKGIELNYKNIQLYGRGCNKQLRISRITPDNVTDRSVAWSSSNKNIADVNGNGLVTSVSNGECRIIATANDGSGKKAECVVTVSGIGIKQHTKTSTYNVPRVTNTSCSSNSIIQEAEKYVGWLPYVWGGTSLSQGVDCSGFVCAVYSQCGYNLWGLRTDLRYAGREVSLSQARAGDILVYSGHVAIYDGKGGRIHAPCEGCTVTHDYCIGGYITIRRIG